MVTTKWQLHKAKNRLAEVIRRAWSEGPQVITLHGAEVAMVVSTEDFHRLSRRATGLVEFFRNSPLVGVDLRVNRRRKLQRAKASRRKLFVR
ncbi:MAG: type II toxin-antitoxin system Phd/YefM family antitoxin [Candidatus Binatia bacterium]